MNNRDQKGGPLYRHKHASCKLMLKFSIAKADPASAKAPGTEGEQYIPGQ